MSRNGTWKFSMSGRNQAYLKYDTVLPEARGDLDSTSHNTAPRATRGVAFRRTTSNVTLTIPCFSVKTVSQYAAWTAQKSWCVGKSFSG
jgi:hypothetical protein